MKYLFAFLLSIFSLPTFSQYGAVNGLCYFGSPVNTVPGQYIPGITSACTVTVYNTGTFTPATIYSSATGASLPNPFTIYSLGYWTFYAPRGQAYDVVVSGGIAPNTALTPTYLYGLSPSLSSGSIGVSTLVLGTTTVSSSSACTPSTTCIYSLSRCASNSSTAVGVPTIGTVTSGTSFVITSESSTNTPVTGDLASVCWKIN